MTAIPESMILDGVTYDVKLTRRYPTPKELGRLAQDVQRASACMASVEAALESVRAEASRLEGQSRAAGNHHRNATTMLALRVEGYELIPR